MKPPKAELIAEIARLRESLKTAQEQNRQLLEQLERKNGFFRDKPFTDDQLRFSRIAGKPAQAKAEEQDGISRKWAAHIVHTNLPGQWGYPCTKPHTHALQDGGFMDYYNIPSDKIEEFEFDNPKATRRF